MHHVNYPGRSKNNERVREWERNNPERCRERKRRWQKSDPGRNRERIWKQQGIDLTWAEFVELLQIQDFRCAICGKVIDTSAHPDHNHMTGLMRGVLCISCNGAVGLVGESTTILENIIVYLQTSEYHFNDPEARKQRSLHRRSSTNAIRQREYSWRQRGIDIRYHEFLDILKLQDYRCATCGCGIGESAHVDHCKATDVIRGCLCPSCNHAIGLIYDSPTIASSMIDYLKSHS